MLWKEVTDNGRMGDYFEEHALNEVICQQCFDVAVPIAELVAQLVAETGNSCVVIVRSGVLDNKDGTFTDLDICKAYLDKAQQEFVGFILLKDGETITEARAISHTTVTSYITELQ